MTAHGVLAFIEMPEGYVEAEKDEQTEDAEAQPVATAATEEQPTAE